MIGYKIQLKKGEEIAIGTMAFYFEKPKGFIFKAGQHAVFTLINPPETDAEGDRRVFCLASAPYEKDLMIAMRMRDTAFKRVLKILPVGSELLMSSALGTFILHGGVARSAVFLVGGIGITPVRSMLLQAAHDKLVYKFYLFYSNRKPSEAAFLDELKALQEKNISYKLISVMSDTEGYIDTAKLTERLADLNLPVYYVVGPPEFVLGMRGILNIAGVNSENVKIDQFSGY